MEEKIPPTRTSEKHSNPSTSQADTAPLSYRNFETPATCPACGSLQLAAAFPTDVSICNSCKVYFRSPRPTQEEIRRFYNSGTTYSRWLPEEDIRRQLWLKRMRLIQRHLSSGRLLDISTGDAHFLQVAQAAGFEITCTEFCEHGASLSLQRGFPVQVGSLEDLSFSAPFDVITLWHVLEHLPHPGQTLQQVWQLLRPGGICAIAVPNEDHALFLPPWAAGDNPFG